MRDISKAAFYTSYYEAAHKLRTNEERHEFYDALLDYIFTEKEPVNVSYNVDLILTAILPIADADLKRKNGGAPQGNDNAKKTTKKQPIVSTVENNLKTMTKTNNVNDNDNVNVNDNDNGNTTETATPAQVNYSKNIFELFKNNNLPCSRKNEITFLQTDFKNALSYIHSSPELKNFTSQDITDAVKNYISVLNNPSCYVSAKMDFFTLVKSKIFYKLLPSNFDVENFKKFDAEKTEPQEKENKPEPVKTVYIKKPCPRCKEKKLEWQPFNDLYVCHACCKTYEKSEIEGGEA